MKGSKNECIDVLREKCVAFKRKQEAEAKAARAEDLNNFENMLLNNLRPKYGEIESDEWKKDSGERRKGVYKSKTHVYKTLDMCINKYILVLMLAWKSSLNKQTKNSIQKWNKIMHQ